MLVLTRKVNERLFIGDSIVLTVVRVNGLAVKIGIEAPPEVAIVREELLSNLDGVGDGRHRAATV